MVAHACCHIKQFQQSRLPRTDNPTVQIYLPSHNSQTWVFSFSLLHFLSLLYPCPAWSGPPYICKEKKWPSSFNSLFPSLTFSLFCHHTPCDCKTLPHSVSIDSDRPQKRPFTLFFSFFFSVFMVILNNVSLVQVKSNWVMLFLGHQVSAWNLCNSSKKQNFLCFFSVLP